MRIREEEIFMSSENRCRSVLFRCFPTALDAFLRRAAHGETLLVGVVLRMVG